MWVYCLLLSAVIFTGVCEGHRPDFVTYLVNKVQDCFQKRQEIFLGMPCFGKDCALSKTVKIVVPCIKLGYDLLYENSTYSLRGDQHVRRSAHCAIDGCSEGIKNGHKTGYFRGCLNGIKACVKQPKDEL
ncbi:hypothetical protein AMEX_G21944 [Astyanax mexicanus]|uniref:Uncharacterized protein n=1 Tax=Astyanax mexicanus TaxID=7994 RepID=A0A8T2L193_ASTMX|nr:hypothetical protein AMEX_G21944 [Astyanax mexicanus]